MITCRKVALVYGDNDVRGLLGLKYPIGGSVKADRIDVISDGRALSLPTPALTYAGERYRAGKLGFVTLEFETPELFEVEHEREQLRTRYCKEAHNIRVVRPKYKQLSVQDVLRKCGAATPTNGERFFAIGVGIDLTQLSPLEHNLFVFNAKHRAKSDFLLVPADGLRWYTMSYEENA